MPDSLRVRYVRGRRLHLPNSTALTTGIVSADPEQDLQYIYQSAHDLMNTAELTPSGQTNATTFHTLVGEIVRKEFLLDPADFTGPLDRGSLDDPNTPNGVFDLQEQVEAARTAVPRATYVFDMASRRQAAQWTLVQKSANPMPSDLVRFDFNDEVHPHLGKGPVVGLLRQDSPEPIRMTQPMPEIARRERLALDPSKTYRVALDVGYVQNPGSNGASEIEVDLGGTPLRFRYARAGVLSGVLQPGSGSLLRLRAWGDAVQIRSIALFEEAAPLGFDTQEERRLWRDDQGRHAVFMPKTSGQPDWALEVRGTERAFADTLGLLPNHDYRLCFEANLTGSTLVTLRVEDTTNGNIQLDHTVQTSGRHCQDFTTGAETRVMFVASGQTGAAQLDDLVFEDAAGLPVPIDVINVSGFTSPPRIAPYYRCADPSEPGGSQLAVSGLVPGAAVELVGELDGQPFAEQRTAADSEQRIDLPQAFTLPTDYVDARQRPVGSTWSAWARGGSPRVATSPMLPRAYWSPFYECGVRAGVSGYTPGSEVWWTVGGVEYGRWPSVAHHAVEGEGPAFPKDEGVRAHAAFCGVSFDEPMPARVIAHPPNRPLATPHVAAVFEHQWRVQVEGLRNGATVQLIDAAPQPHEVLVRRASASRDTMLQLPRPATPAMQLYAVQSFPGCLSATAVPPTIRPVRPCAELPVPSVAFPYPGDAAVRITEFVPGATIIVVDAAGVVLGHQPGPNVALNRPLLGGETIRVTQKLGPCQSDEATAIAVGVTDG